MIDLNRRTFLGSVAALTLLPTTPAPAAVRGVSLVLPPPAPVKPAPWWGFSTDEDLWQGPFISREEAIASAIEEGHQGQGFITGLCHPRTLSHPDYEEAIVEWLCSRREGQPLSEALRDAFSGCNEEHDFEGEVSDEIDVVDWDALEAAVVPLLEAAIGRSGFFVAASPADGMFDGSEAILDALQADEVFARDLAAAAAAWSDSNSLLDVSRMVDLTDRQSIVGEAEA